jgi:hypothetical protein
MHIAKFSESLLLMGCLICICGRLAALPADMPEMAGTGAGVRVLPTPVKRLHRRVLVPTSIRRDRRRRTR